jgi:RHS repeat-associated protein
MYPYAPAIEPLQTINYKYNIRGWLTQINDPSNLGTGTKADLFAEKINYTSYISELGQTPDNAQFNGNISSVTWTTVQGTEAYAYNYDKQNRLTKAQYGTVTAGVFTKKNQYSLPEVSYDLQGNILTLKRNGNIETAGFMDDLEYGYKGNKLMVVFEKGDKTKGFIDGKKAQTEYDYDLNGNMTRDDNSKITEIQYNSLNLPKKITKSNFTDAQNKMVTSEETYFYYTAAGQKLAYECKTKYADNTTLWAKTMYEGSIVYTGTSSTTTAPTMVINYILHPEGRIRVSKVNNVPTFTYEYHIKDHLGNVRVAFDAVGSSMSNKIPVAFQYTDYDPYGMEHEQAGVSGTQGQEQTQTYLFTGKELYRNIGWADYGARFYNSSLGRWMNVDPLPKPHESVYAAFANNPICNVDPDGRDSINFRQWMDSDGDVQISQTFIDDGKPGLVTYGYDEINDEWVHEYTPPVVVNGQATVRPPLKVADNMPWYYNFTSLPLGNSPNEGEGTDNGQGSVDKFADKYIGEPIGNLIVGGTGIYNLGVAIHIATTGTDVSGREYNSNAMKWFDAGQNAVFGTWGTYSNFFRNSNMIEDIGLNITNFFIGKGVENVDKKLPSDKK